MAEPLENMAVNPEFVAEVRQDEALFDLARAGFLFAQTQYPQHAPERYLAQLNDMAQQLSDRLQPNASRHAKLTGLCEFLFIEQGFRGNELDYYDPRNSFLNEVLDRRLGIPISLSVVFLSLASRLAIPSYGIAFPGHFLVGAELEDRTSIIDTFAAGKDLDTDALIARLAAQRIELESRAALISWLQPARKREILIRQLRNLKQIYVGQALWTPALNVLNHILAVHPASPSELLERADVYERLDCHRAALTDYDRYLADTAATGHNDALLRRIDAVRTRVKHLH